jgi:hypothetical protein
MATLFIPYGIISPHTGTNILLEAGHATIRRSYRPSDEDIKTCVDIIESVIRSIYVHPEQADELANRVPKRI